MHVQICRPVDMFFRSEISESNLPINIGIKKAFLFKYLVSKNIANSRIVAHNKITLKTAKTLNCRHIYELREQRIPILKF